MIQKRSRIQKKWRQGSYSCNLYTMVQNVARGFGWTAVLREKVWSLNTEEERRDPRTAADSRAHFPCSRSGRPVRTLAQHCRLAALRQLQPASHNVTSVLAHCGPSDPPLHCSENTDLPDLKNGIKLTQPNPRFGILAQGVRRPSGECQKMNQNSFYSNNGIIQSNLCQTVF